MQTMRLGVIALLYMTLVTAALPTTDNHQKLPSTMTAVEKRLSAIPCFTPFSCVKTYETKTPTPSSNQVLVKVAASSINPCDVDYLEYDIGCKGASGTLGMDLAGTVVAVGANCSRIKVGDKVWADIGGLSGDTGAMAQYALVSEEQTGLAPSTLNLTEAGTIPLVGLTAYEMWIKIWAAYGDGPKSNLTVVITSGTGGTGFMAVQLAKHAYGASTVVTSTSGASNIALAKDLGADKVVDYKKTDVFSVLDDNSVDVVLDNYGAKGTADTAMRVLRSGGVYLILPGGGGGTISKHPKTGVKQVNFGFTQSADHRSLDALRSLFEARKLRAHVFQQFPLKDAAAAFALSKTGTVAGKVAVVIG